MAPAYRPHLADGWLDIRLVEAAVLARSRLVAAVLTGTLGRSRVYRSWPARSVDVRAADGQPIWLSTDGEVATAETGFTHSKHPRGLVVYRRQGTVTCETRGRTARCCPRW
jgi:undecaprenyl-diphosphatase